MKYYTYNIVDAETGVVKPVNAGALSSEIAADAELSAGFGGVAIINMATVEIKFADVLPDEQKDRLDAIYAAHTGHKLPVYVKRIAVTLPIIASSVTQVDEYEIIAEGSMNPAKLCNTLRSTIYTIGWIKVEHASGTKPEVTIQELDGVTNDLVRPNTAFGDTAGAWKTFMVETTEPFGAQKFCRYALVGRLNGAVSMEFRALTAVLSEDVS